GETRGLRRALETVLMRRFGGLPPAVEAALAAADLDTLDEWLRAAVTADTLTEVGIPPQQPPHELFLAPRRQPHRPGRERPVCLRVSILKDAARALHLCRFVDEPF